MWAEHARMDRVLVKDEIRDESPAWESGKPRPSILDSV